MVSQSNMNDAGILKKAINLGLSIDHDLAMAKLNLAGIAFNEKTSKKQKIFSVKLKSLIKEIC